jgi:hypothetical protein
MQIMQRLSSPILPMIHLVTPMIAALFSLERDDLKRLDAKRSILSQRGASMVNLATLKHCLDSPSFARRKLREE